MTSTVKAYVQRTPAACERMGMRNIVGMVASEVSDRLLKHEGLIQGLWPIEKCDIVFDGNHAWNPPSFYISHIIDEKSPLHSESTANKNCVDLTGYKLMFSVVGFESSTMERFTANALFSPDDVHANEQFVDCMHDGVIDLSVLDETVPSESQKKHGTIPLANDDESADKLRPLNHLRFSYSKTKPPSTRLSKLSLRLGSSNRGLSSRSSKSAVRPKKGMVRQVSATGFDTLGDACRSAMEQAIVEVHDGEGDGQAGME